jgi:gluconolactonase
MKKIIIIALAWMSVISCEKKAKETQTSTQKEASTTAISMATIVSADAKVKELATGFQFLEGPIWDTTNKRLLFSEVMANKLHQWTADAGVRLYLEPSWYAGGNTFDLQENLISCQGGARQIARILPDKTMEVITNTYQGKKFNSPNDVVVKSDGTIWFTDPDYGLLAAYGDKANEHKELDAFHIFKYDPKTKETVSVSATLSKPNGLVFSKDETQLFVGNSEEGDRKLIVFEVTKTNTLTNMKVLSSIESTTWGIDGLKMDSKGNLYAACGDGVNVFTSKGKFIGKIATNFEVTNLCFGGEDRKTLFLTGHESLYAVPVLIAGN